MSHLLQPLAHCCQGAGKVCFYRPHFKRHRLRDLLESHLFGEAQQENRALSGRKLVHRRPYGLQLGAREELQAVWSAVDQLPPRQRAVFLLRFAEEMTLEEIAQAMTLEVGTVKAHLSRALTAVRKRLKETGYHARTSEQ